MSDYHRPATQPTARKQHRCIYCYGPIPVGEFYMQQTGYYDGAAYRNKYHAECWTSLDFDSATDEFMPGEGEMPERIKALLAQRAAKE